MIFRLIYVASFYFPWWVWLLQEKNVIQSHRKNTFSTATGLNEILMESNGCDYVLMNNFRRASDMVQLSASVMQIYTAIMPVSQILSGNISPLDKCIRDTFRKYVEKLLLKEADRKPRASRRNRKHQLRIQSAKSSRKVMASVRACPHEIHPLVAMAVQNFCVT